MQEIEDSQGDPFFPSQLMGLEGSRHAPESEVQGGEKNGDTSSGDNGATPISSQEQQDDEVEGITQETGPNWDSTQGEEQWMRDSRAAPDMLADIWENGKRLRGLMEGETSMLVRMRVRVLLDKINADEEYIEHAAARDMGSGLVTGGWEIARRDAHRLGSHEEIAVAVQAVLEAKEAWEYAKTAREHLRKREEMEGMGERIRKMMTMMEKNEKVAEK